MQTTKIHRWGTFEARFRQHQAHAVETIQKSSTTKFLKHMYYNISRNVGRREKHGTSPRYIISNFADCSIPLFS